MLNILPSIVRNVPMERKMDIDFVSTDEAFLRSANAACSSSHRDVSSVEISTLRSLVP